MAYQPIAIGTTANDGTGDDLRAGATKANANFTELYASYRKHKYDATVDPTHLDDASDGYAVGSLWMRPDTGDLWRCRDATADAAKWVQLDNANHPGYIAGNWYPAVPSTVATLASGITLTTTSTRFIPFIVKQRVTITELGARVNTASSGGLFGLAIYAASPTTNKPVGTPLASVTGLSTTTVAVVSAALGAPVTLEPGLYWQAAQVDNTVATFQTLPSANAAVSMLIGDASLASASGNAAGGINALTNNSVGYAGGFVNMTSASWGNTFTAGTILLWFKVAA